MTAAELLALSLGLSLAAAALGWAIMRALEGRVADPVLRERAWAAALYIPTLPPLAVGLMLLTPAPTWTPPPASAAAATTSAVIELHSAAGLPPADLTQAAAVLVLVLAGLFALLRVVVLGVRAARLRELIGATRAASPELHRAVEAAALRMDTTVPTLRVSSVGSEALLVGLRRPVLVLPATLAKAPDSAATRAVCAHELAHLKRGDHRALWLEEALLAALAINPLLRIIRDYRAAAREEACDAAALTGAGDDARRLYARSLLEAVRRTGFQRTAPALSFTSARRTFVMHRLKAILVPVSPAGPRPRRLVVGLAALIAAGVGAGSVAIAAQREPVMVDPPADVAADPRPAPAAAPRPAANISAGPAERPAPVPALSPSPQPVAAAALAEATPAPVAGATQDSARPSDITRVTWSQHPTPMYPAVAAANGIDSGTVALSCAVEADGRASGCTVLTESPEGAGFGDAALAAMERARFSPSVMETAAPGARARFTIRFRLAE